MKNLYTILFLLVSLVAKAQSFPYRYLSPVTISPTEAVTWRKMKKTFAKEAHSSESDQPKETPGNEHFSNPDQVFIQRATEMVMQHLTDSEYDRVSFANDVAMRVGFNTPKYFSKCFKKEFGIFPKEYADQLKEQQESN